MPSWVYAAVADYILLLSHLTVRPLFFPSLMYSFLNFSRFGFEVTKGLPIHAHDGILLKRSLDVEKYLNWVIALMDIC